MTSARMAFLIAVFMPLSLCRGEDWPMWRCDAARSASTTEQLPADLERVWQRSFGKRRQAWDDPLNLDLMTYDRLFEPIVMNGRMFLGFNDSGKLLAIDVRDGRELWSAYAEAPIRLPPAAEPGRVYFCSDDGFLYCVDEQDGSVLWKFFGAPNPQKAIGNRRLTSAWPARGGPVLKDGNVYFAASIWPFMSTFIYALDAEKGTVRWVNDRTGSQYIKQPHSAPSFAGVAPQGALVATDSLLLVPGGRSVPAAFERDTGKIRYFELNAGGKGTGGSFVAADNQHFFVHTRRNGTRAFEIETGVKTAFQVGQPVLADGIVYAAGDDEADLKVVAYGSDQKEIWSVSADGRGDLILAGDTLYAAGHDGITMIQLPGKQKDPKVIGQIGRGLKAERLLAANGMLFAVTAEGDVTAFGKTDAESRSVDSPASDPNAITKSPEKIADTETPWLSGEQAQGYAFWFGNPSDAALSTIQRSPFEQLAVVTNDATEAAQLRRYLDDQNKLNRVSVHHSTPADFRPPSHVAHMVFVGQELSADLVAQRKTLERIYQAVRPFGGQLHLFAPKSERTALAKAIRAFGLEQAVVELADHGVVVHRVGPLPGAADWTHQYGDVANTLKSDDRRVKLPLGVLWFGGSSHMDVLPRHGHGPPEQVIGGRLFIEGMNSLSARDVYTGRVLWKRQFKDLGTYDVYFDDTFDDTPLDPKYNQVHIPGANGRGTNFVATSDRVYILEGPTCHVLDPKSGETLREIHMPKEKSGEQPEWGYIGVYKDVLIGGVGFAKFRGRLGLTFESDGELSDSKKGFGSKSLDRAGSRALIGFDRHSGEQLWRVDSVHSFWHNGIVAGGEQVYCLDKNPKQIEEAMIRRGKSLPKSYRIVAFDYRTGEVNWQVNEGIFGTWLGYSERHDLLLHAGAKASDRLYAEVSKGMAVYSGEDGSVVWRNSTLNYAGPCILHNDWILTNANSYTESAGAFHILDGRPKLVKNPLTGQMQPWKLTRAYGCNNIIASENLLTFRSGAAGFYDLKTDGGTGNLGGFKSGCTSNLVVAGGVLNAPDYTRTCSCAYQNQTSLALVHMPDIDVWSVHQSAGQAISGRSIRQAGINFGAPGDRRDQDGVLWLEYPVVAGESAAVAITTNSEAAYYQQHSGRFAGTPLPWVMSSGVKGLTDLRVIPKLQEKVTLHTGLPIEYGNVAEEDEQGDIRKGEREFRIGEEAGSRVSALRFENINIPRGATIEGSYIQFESEGRSSEPTSLIITAEDSPDSKSLRDESHGLSSRDPASQEVAWRPKEWDSGGLKGKGQRTPDLSAIVQAIVARDDWSPGNSITFLFSGPGRRIAKSTKHKKSAPRLIVNTELVLDSELVEPEKPPARFNLDLYFAAPDRASGGVRVFDVYLQEKRVFENVTLDSEDPGRRAFVKSIRDVPIENSLRIQLKPKQGEPALSGIRVERLDQ